MKLQDYLGKLKAFNWKKYNLYYAILFGSLVKKGEGNDIDIAVEFKKEKINLSDYIELWSDLTDYLNSDKVDLVIIKENTGCYLIHEIFNNGLILYMEDWWRVHRRAVVCEDFLIDAKKLNLIENAGKAILRKW
ncbi:MAG: nucleotidyltransferase domain-containing protein [Sulfolobaceae archaeon]